MENMVKLHSAFFSDPFSISLTSLSIACIFLLAMPFFLTILAKHQAFAPSSATQLHAKLNSVKVEFSLRPSAKAFESSSWIDQTLGPPSPPFRLENLSGCWTVGFCMKYGFFYLLTFVTSSLAEFDQTQPLIDIRTYQIDIKTHPGQSDHHKTTSEESRCI